MRRGKYPALSPTLRWITTLAYTQPVNQWETGLFKKNPKSLKKQLRALSRSLISEYPGYSLISEPITAREKHYSLVGYMLTVDIYFLLSNQSARKVLSTCSADIHYLSRGWHWKRDWLVTFPSPFPFPMVLRLSRTRLVDFILYFLSRN